MSQREGGEPPEFPPVTSEESGQKLLRFLERRLNLPSALLHRWMRTGQIRLNGGRCKPFGRVQTGDIIRLPPFAFKISFLDGRKLEHDPGRFAEKIKTSLAGADLSLLGIHGDIWALDKPAGLPVHGGSAHDDSVAQRLFAAFSDWPFTPAPCHRLDKKVGGVLLVGASYEASRNLQEYFQAGKIIKEYFALVEGRWAEKDALYLRHYLGRENYGDVEKTRASLEPFSGSSLGISVVQPLLAEPDASLLRIRLLTGRKHQLRAQLAASGHPVFGDCKYGAKVGNPFLKLHAFRVVLPDGQEFISIPSWIRGKLDEIPQPLVLNEGANDVNYSVNVD